MASTSSMNTSLQQVTKRVDAVVAAAGRSVLDVPHRSTAEQREAFLESLYTNYAELHSQRDEVDTRKRQMDIDMYESNQKDIHDVLFANLDASDGELGDWDTWERVEAVVKRYVYGRPQHTASEKKEVTVMQSRIDSLQEAIREKASTLATVQENFEAVQQELGALLKLTRLKDRQVQTLSTQNRTIVLQLRCVQRECAALRGTRLEEGTSALKEDLRFLIEANKKLEQDNQNLRRHVNATTEFGASTTLPRSSMMSPPGTPVQARSPMRNAQPAENKEVSGAMEHGLDKCMEDDSFRRELIEDHIPISGLLMDAERQVEQWKRRLEAEVNSSMEMLDHDALEMEEVISELEAAPFGRHSTMRGSRMENGVFISYANYQSVAEAKILRATVSVAGAPPPLSAAQVTGPTIVAHAVSRPRVEAAKTAAGSSAFMPAIPAPLSESPPKEEHKQKVVAAAARQKRSVISATRTVNVKKKSVSAGGLVAVDGPAKNAPPTSRTQRLLSNAAPPASSGTLPLSALHLQKEILQCAELSRVNAIRRELLHVSWLRQRMAEEKEQALASAAGTHADSKVSRVGKQSPSPRPGRSAVEADGSAASEPYTAFGVQPSSPLNSNLSLASAPDRLRQVIQESRFPSISGAHRELDGGEVESSQAQRKSNSVRANNCNAVVSASAVEVPGLQTHLQGRRLPSIGEQRSDRGVPLTDAAMSHTSAGRTSSGKPHIISNIPHGVSLPISSGVEDSTDLEGDASFQEGRNTLPFNSRLLTKDGPGPKRFQGPTAALVRHVDSLRSDLQQLRTSAVVFGAEVQEALEVLRALLEPQEMSAQEEAEESALQTEHALRRTAQEAVEEAAVLRTTQLLEERFGALLPEGWNTDVPLPDTATDDAWLAHELRQVAVAMVRGSVQSHQMANEMSGGVTQPFAADDANVATSTTTTPTRNPARSAPADVDMAKEHQYFQNDVLRLIRMWSRNDSRVAKEPGEALQSVESRTCRETAEDFPLKEGERRLQRRGYDAYQLRGQPSQVSPVPAQWYWRAQDFLSPQQDLKTAAIQAPSLKGSGHTAFVLRPPLRSMWGSPTDIASIRPTVLRYEIGVRKQQMQHRVNDVVQRATAYIYGSEFEDFVKEFIVPVMSTAMRVTHGSPLNPALLVAVRQLRAKARQQYKRKVRLLFDRVANNIRTRTLLRRGVMQGEGFVSYIGVLYNKWRSNIDKERQLLCNAQAHQHSELLSLMHLRTPAAAVSEKPSGRNDVGTERRGNQRVPYHLGRSSFHFDEAVFSNRK